MSESAKRKLWKFNGGVHPDFHKDASTTQAIAISPLPKKLILPIQQHIGAVAEILVVVGDKVSKGQVLTKIADEQLGAVIHAPSSGTISAIEKRAIPHPSTLSGLCLVLELDGQDDWGDCRLEPYADFTQCDATTLLERIDVAGLVGLGGAAFPSFVKVDSSAKQGVETLIINAAECEPYISCDDRLMRERADEIVIGIRILLQLLKPKQCLIGIEDNKPQAISAMQQATTVLDNVHVCEIPTIYPSGGEKQLIRILTGKEVPVDGIPLNLNILCHNIATTYALYKAVVKGEPLISRVLTITGDGVQNPQNIEALIGTAVSDLVMQAGGYTTDAQRLIMGGPMMGFALSHDDIPMVKASNCFLVASDAVLQQAHSPHSSQLQMPCIRCGKCVDACPANLLPQQLYWHTQAKDYERVSEHKLNSCIECGCCDFVCPSHIPLVSYFRFAKSEIHAQELALVKSDIARERHEFLEFRKVREKQERDEKRRKHKEALQKKKAGASADKAKKDAIQAALDRAKAKKIARETEAKVKDAKNETEA
ncbi:MAG TPA: electron transport complex subunit RsxC [Leucothrix mucor]|nr:electron transport complex subunit RsxC [Leucothrix mucor]